MAQAGRQATPPYVSFRTFLNFLDWLNEDGVPSRIDRSFWGERLSGANGPQLMGALRFFRLLDMDSRPRPELEEMARDPARRRIMIHDRMLECYGDAVKGLTLERASLGELRDRFRVYSIDGETLRKALAFFVHAAEYSGVTLSSHITRKARLAKKTDGNRKRPRSTKMRMQET
ncbi:MAG: hypothetical protein NTU41_02935, partial [Chloroflexi bacterium]|nr:hypothetical protein [Chloroflexota bacterium]